MGKVEPRSPPEKKGRRLRAFYGKKLLEYAPWSRYVETEVGIPG
jgi:hypothetical protein